MSDIFVSYDDLDRPRVWPLVEALERRGWSVWWDHRISTGESFADVIERELQAASCVIVAWTNTSIQSDWVRAEADEAWKRRKLLPVLLDRVRPPMPFGQIQSADLVGWKEYGHDGFAELVADLRERIGKTPAQVPQPDTSRWITNTTTIGLGALVLLTLAVLAWYVGARPSERDVASSDRAGPRAAVVPVAAEGYWQGHVKYPDGAIFEERFRFDVNGRDLSGTASLRGYGNRRGIMDGTVQGNRLFFRTTGRVQANLFAVRDVTYVYRGVLEGEAIHFSVMEEGTGDPPFEFTATRISAEQANRIATGGTRPRLSGIDGGSMYAVEHVRSVVAGRQPALDACYVAGEYDPVNHEFVDYWLTLSAGGQVEQVEVRPPVASLEPCMRDALAAMQFGPTKSGKPGRIRITLQARLPWNP